MLSLALILRRTFVLAAVPDYLNIKLYYDEGFPTVIIYNEFLKTCTR